MAKVVVDANYQPVKAGADNAAFIFNADDPRLEKHQKAAKAATAPVSAAKPSDKDDNDGSVERVGPKAK